MPIENQRDEVRRALLATPTPQWLGIAVEAKMTLRTIYNVIDEKRDPRYGSVFKLYTVLKTREAKEARKKARRAGK